MNNLSFTILSILIFCLACNKKDDDNDEELIKIEGFLATDANGNTIGTFGNADDDWKVINWSQLSSKEQAFLNFPDNINLDNTVVTTLNNPIAYPNPVNYASYINLHAADSVKIKIALVDEKGNVLKTFAEKIKGNKPFAFDVSNDNVFPAGKSFRYYYSYSAAAQVNFKAGYGDIKICRLSGGVPYTACF